jgi:ParB family chromosome partitioning protein
MSSIHSSVLGRGLGSLLPASKAQATAAAAKDGTPLYVPIEKISAMVDQPRRHFDDRALRQLSLSIREQGILQPLLVVPDENGRFSLIAGERRLRAAQLAGLTEVPVVVRQIGPTEAFEVALIENIQRQDLNAIEEAEAYDRLISEHGYTQDALSKRVGKDRSTITNALRLLKLSAAIRTRIVQGSITAGHARALLAVEDVAFQEALAERIESEGLSVRAVERLVQDDKDAQKPSRDKAPKAPVRPEQKQWGRALESVLGRRVAIRSTGDGGVISIPFKDAADIEALLSRISATR